MLFIMKCSLASVISIFGMCLCLLSCTKKTEISQQDGDLFVGKSQEGIEIEFKVLSVANKTAQVGNGDDDFNSSKGRSIDKSYEGILTIPEEINGYKVVQIGTNAFGDCSITSVTIPNGVRTIMERAFSGCKYLSRVVFPESLITIERDAFYGTRLSIIRIPESIEYLNNHAFNHEYIERIEVDSRNKQYDSRNNCNAIIESSTNKIIVGCTNTQIPSSVTAIGGNAFSGCTRLTSLSIPKNIRTIGNGAFWRCENLATISLSEGLEIIDNGAFACTAISSITIPSSVSVIGERPFGSCKNLVKIKVNRNNKKYDSRDDSNVIIETSTNKLIQGCKSSKVPPSVTSIDKWAFFGIDTTNVIYPSNLETEE